MIHSVAHLISRVILSPLLLIWYAMGWRAEGTIPNLDKFIALGVPHTTNWDYFHMLAIAIYAGRKPFVTAKHTIFKGPVGWFVRLAGGIPIDRTKSSNLVQQLATQIQSSDRMMLVFTPEGTRSRSPYWKTGFYYTAVAANVPIVCGYIDYQRKCVGLGLVVYPTGDIETDFEKIRGFYGQHGYPKHPERLTPLELPPEKAVITD